MLKSITVDRTKLLQTLQENRDKHVAEYDEAVGNYRHKIVKALRKRLETVEQGGKIDLYFNLPEPVSYAREYDQAISMIEWSEEGKIELSEHDFRSFVLDEWDFKSHFAAATLSYNGR